MKKNIFIVIAMLTCIAFTAQAQENYWDYTWHETNGGPVWSEEISYEEFQLITKIDTCTIGGTQYLCAMGIFAVEEENLGAITIEQAGIIFYDGATWSNLRPTLSCVINYFKFQGNEYINTYDEYVDGIYYGGIKKWNGNSWQSAWGTTGMANIAYVDVSRDRVIFSQILPALMPDGETVANHTFVFSYDGIEVDTIGKFRGNANDYAQIGNRGYVTVSPMGDSFGGYGKGIYAIDLDSLKFIEYNLTDYPADAVGSMWAQVESNDDGTLLFAKEVLGYVAIFDGTTWTEFTEDGNNWSFNSDENGIIVSGDELCNFTSYFDDGNFTNDAFKASNGIPKAYKIVKYKDELYSVRNGGLSETYRGSLYIESNPIEPNEWMESNILIRMLTANIPPDTPDTPDLIEKVLINNINFYPNPATDIVYVESNTLLDQQLVLFTLMGEKVQCTYTYDGEKYIVDVSNLPKGVYTLGGKLLIIQ